jgi:hypothetical protein
VAKHVDGVSKHFSQMHMAPQVELRERQARACIEERAVEVMELIASHAPTGR